MRLYTSQPLIVYETLMASKTWTADPFRNADEHDEEFQRAYDWLVADTLSKRILPESKDTQYPVWAWYQWNGVKQPKPDLRYSTVRDDARERTQVLLELEIDESRVVLTDYDGWHWVLNYFYIGTSVASEDFERRCKEQNANYMRQRPLAVPALDKELTDTWQIIFDINKTAQYLEESPERACIQATFWEIRPEDVISATKFEKRGKTEKLPVPHGASQKAGTNRHEKARTVTGSDVSIVSNAGA